MEALNIKLKSMWAREINKKTFLIFDCFVHFFSEFTDPDIIHISHITGWARLHLRYNCEELSQKIKERNKLTCSIKSFGDSIFNNGLKRLKVEVTKNIIFINDLILNIKYEIIKYSQINFLHMWNNKVYKKHKLIVLSRLKKMIRTDSISHLIFFLKLFYGQICKANSFCSENKYIMQTGTIKNK